VRHATRRVTVSALAVLLLAVIAACTSPTSPSNAPPFSQTDLVVGTGAAVGNGDAVAVHYTGWLYDASAFEQKGTMFDTTAGSAPYTFVLGTGQVIAGWDQGIAGMRVGGIRRLVIPPNLAYGATGNGPIPPNASLVFEVQLVTLLQAGIDSSR